MKVLFVLPRMVVGGIERITLNLIRQFQEDGVACALALRRCHGELLEEARALTPVHELAAGGMHQFVPNLARLIAQWRPTHIVVAFADVALLTLWAKRWARSSAPVVYGVHNAHGLETARVGLVGRIRYLVDRWTSGAVCHQANVVVACSDGVGREVIEMFGVPAERVRTIYNPIFTQEQWSKFSVRQVKQGAEVISIVAIGRLVRQKGFDVLVDAMSEVVGHGRWRLDIYGDGPDRADLCEQIERRGLSGKVVLRGYLEDPMSCLSGADIFVLSSRFEGLPTVLVLAMAAGVQIVSTDCRYGPSEILLGGALGVLVQPDNSRDLAEGVSRLLSRATQVDPEGLRARAADFTAERSAGLWLELLRGLKHGSHEPLGP